MRRADRLFEIIQHLRRGSMRSGASVAVRARDLGEALGVSERTVYRDIRDLVASGVPIQGEAGIGYVLRSGFDLPPMMFKEAELEALVLGARIVRSWADPELADAAANVIAKVEAVIPERLRAFMADTALVAPSRHWAEPVGLDIAAVRRAIRTRTKISFAYIDEENRRTERTVRPLCLAFFGQVWLLGAWCELRLDFRSFRLDRMQQFTVLEERFVNDAGRSLRDFMRASPDWWHMDQPRN